MLPEAAAASAESLLSGQERESFLETAFALGARICRDALWAADRCNWIGPSTEPLSGRWRQVHRAYSADLYGGTSGIGWVLARMSAATGEDVFRITALGALRHALTTADQIGPVSRIGVFSGWSGIALAALESAAILDNEEIRELALRLLKPVVQNRLDRSHWDLVAGSAGAVPALLAIQRLAPRSKAGAAAQLLGEDLVQRAARSKEGWSWGDAGTPGSTVRGNLTGFAHGAAGAAWALLELFAATDEGRFRKAAEKAFDYERSHFDAERGNWPDLRDPAAQGLQVENPDQPQFMRAWCHGAPGIALSRLRAFQILKDDRYAREAETAVETTLGTFEPGPEMSQMNHSLCHGRGGNADILVYAWQLLPDRADLLRKAAEVAREAQETYQRERRPWPCGTQGTVEVPGLMLGLAGIAHFYLRLYDPAKHSTPLMPGVPA